MIVFAPTGASRMPARGCFACSTQDGATRRCTRRGNRENACKSREISAPATDSRSAFKNAAARRTARMLGKLPFLAAAVGARGRAVAGPSTLEQLAHGARRVIDREMRVGIPTGIAVGDGDAPEQPPRALDGILIILLVEQRVCHVAVAMRPPV